MVSQIISVILYTKVPDEKDIPNFFRFFLLFVFEISKKNHHFIKSEKIHTNLIKYIKIFQPSWKMEVLKLHQLKKKIDWILYIEMNKNVPHKIVRKIDI